MASAAGLARYLFPATGDVRLPHPPDDEEGQHQAPAVPRQDPAGFYPRQDDSMEQFLARSTSATSAASAGSAGSSAGAVDKWGVESVWQKLSVFDGLSLEGIASFFIIEEPTANNDDRETRKNDDEKTSSDSKNTPRVQWYPARGGHTPPKNAFVLDEEHLQSEKTGLTAEERARKIGEDYSPAATRTLKKKLQPWRALALPVLASSPALRTVLLGPEAAAHVSMLAKKIENGHGVTNAEWSEVITAML